MKVIYYSILIAAALEFKGVTTQEEEDNEYDRCIYKETCSSKNSMRMYESCFKEIPMEDQGPILKAVEDNYGLEEKPIREFIQSECEDSERGREIFDSLYDQIKIAKKNNTNEENKRKYSEADACFLVIYNNCEFKEQLGSY